MVGSIDDAVVLVGGLLTGNDFGGYIADTGGRAAVLGLTNAVASRDTPALYNWLMDSFSFQGISDRVASRYIADHGNATWKAVEASLQTSRCRCPKLGSFASYTGCRYRKVPKACAQPSRIQRCPVPTLPLRKGDLNQLAFSLYYFLRDRCDGDLVGYIDRLFAAVDTEACDDPIAAKAAALTSAFSEVFGVSNKLIAMTFAVLLLGADADRADWIEVGRHLVAVDSLVHNFLHRTGILVAFAGEHPYGDRCYGNNGCAVILHALARRLDAAAINPDFPAVFPRLVQYAIWQFCAETGADVCNGRQIDDRFSCTNQTCPVGGLCGRLPLKATTNSEHQLGSPDPVG